ncbi:MAG TPA: autotransporter domain-containing protein [Candidatus Omnitrophota bacterium]|nr:autotransporter domain-containing protein [Candidatus Omnitrophota bacterium]
MKKIISLVTAFSFFLLSGPFAFAGGSTTYYWDTNGATAGFGSSSGTWGTDAYWSTSSAGTDATTDPPTTDLDDINFGTATLGIAAPGNTIAVNGTVDMNSITFGAGQTDAVIISGGTAIHMDEDAAITVDNTTDTINTNISGCADTLTKLGTGTLILAGTNTYTGATCVDEGILNLTGDIQSSGTTYVRYGGTLKGTGTTGNMKVFADGVLNPGDSVGTISSVGDVEYGGGGKGSEGGMYKWEINDAAGTAGTDPGWDHHSIDGGLNITASSSAGDTFTIDITSLTGDIAGNAANFTKTSNYTWTIATAAAGVTGFDAASFTLDASNFTNDITGTVQNGYFEIFLSGNMLQLLYYAAVDETRTHFATDATNSNARAVGEVFDNMSDPSSDMSSVLTALGNLSDSEAGSAEETMSPTVDGAVVQSVLSMGSQVVDTINIHLENMPGQGTATGVSTGDDCFKDVSIWTQGLGDYAHQDSRGTSNGYNSTSWGLICGADLPIANDSIRMGIGAGYGQTFVRSKDFSGRTDIDSIPASAYMTYDDKNNPFYIDGVFTFMYNTYSGTRNVSAGPTIQRVANSDYDGQQYIAYFEGGYSFFLKNFILTPLASINYTHLHVENYTETGADALNLKVAAQDYDMCQTGLGAKIAYPFQSAFGELAPDMHFKWLYDWVGDSQATSANFSGGGTSFATNGFSPACSAYNIGTKLTIKTKYNIALDLNYDYLMKEDYYEHYGFINVRYSF